MISPIFDPAFRKPPARCPGWHRRLLGFAAASWLTGSALAVEVDLTPVSSADGTYAQVTVAGQTAWQNTGTSRYLYARRPDSFAFTAGQTLYARVTYFDDAQGVIDLQYDARGGAYTTSALHTRTSRVGSGRFVDGFFELPDVLFNRRQNGGTDFRVVCGTSTGPKAPVRRITLADTPFADADFQRAVSRVWRTRYTGPAKDHVDATTLKGKVMTGYQGWFGTPNDIADTRAWRHWVRNNTMTAENFTIDAWPDLTAYDPSTLVRAAEVLTAGGAPAYLFSSRTLGVVQQHFRWMRQHNMDGAFLQRFHPKAGAEPEWVLRNVSQAAAEEGRIWAVEYDVSGMADATVAAKLQADWEWLTTHFDLLNDPRYAHENGKPVVFIWGFPFADRNFTPASANAAVDYFKAQGTYVIGGIPNSWNSLSADWKSHIEKYHGVLVWQNKSTADAAFFRGRGQDFFPHIWPGFSWAHLKQLPATPPTQYTDRQGGQFYWDKGRDWINGGGADRLFIGMFDEYDESTHVMPMTDDPPNPFADYGRFIDNQGKPGDWWLMLTDELKRMMWGQRANTGTLPTVAALANRSNIGPEASIDLGATDIANSLTRVPNADDGDTVVETLGGKEGRGNASPTTTHRYLYFNVDNGFAFQLANGDVTVEVEYYDSFYGSGAGTVLGLQYDGAADSHTTHPQSITTTGSETWRTVRFEIADAWFAGRQNGGADFLLTTNGRKLSVNRVWVRLPEGKAHPFTWTNATAGPALAWSQNANWLGGIVGQSDPTSTVRLLPGQTLTGGAVLIENDLTGQQFGSLELGGTAAAAADTTVTLGGNGFSLGGSAPAMVLEAMKSAFDLTYDIAAAVTLLGTAQVGGDGDATFRISGALGGTAGITKTGTSALTLAGANAYSGDTTIIGGTLRLGAGDAIPDGPGKGGVVLTGTLDLNTFSETINGLSGTGTVDTVAGGTPTLTVGGNDATSTFSGVITDTAGTLALTKTGSGTLTLAGVNSYTGPTLLSAGTVQLVVPNALPSTTALSLGAGATVGGLNLESVDQTIGSLAVLSDSASANTLTIGAGKTLTITGGATIGFNSAANTTSRLTASGTGTLAITGGNLQLGGSTTTNVGSAATLDLSGLSNFIYHNSGGTVRVGDATNPNGGGTGSSTLILADASTLTAASLTTNSPAMQQQFIKLGRGTNIINANSVSVGLTGGRSSGGTLDFNEAGGTLKVRGTHSTDAVPTRANLTVGYGNATTATHSASNMVNLNGHYSDLLLNSLQIAGRTNSGGGSTTTATFNFDAGKLDATGITVGVRAGTSGNTGLVTGTLNLGGGTVAIGGSGLLVASNTSSLAANAVSGTVNISGGTVTVGATTGTSIILGSNSNAANGGATAALNLTGGSLTVTGDIRKSTTTGAVDSMLSLSGGILDMGGSNIGAADTGAITLTAESGTLSNVASINGTGGLTKTTEGTLVLQGTNTYSGATTIDAGTLALGADHALPDHSSVAIGNATLDAAAFDDTLGTLDAAGSAVIHLDPGARLAFADSSAIDWDDIPGTLHLTGDFVAGSSLRFGTAGGGLTPTQLGKISAAGFIGFALDGGGYLTAIAAGSTYAFWAASQAPPLTGGPNGDADLDGVSNLIEYALADGQERGTLTGNTLSFTKRGAPWGDDLTYEIETSATLADGSWVILAKPPVVETAAAISYTLTPPAPVKSFVRLRVTLNTP